MRECISCGSDIETVVALHAPTISIDGRRVATVREAFSEAMFNLDQVHDRLHSCLSEKHLILELQIHIPDDACIVRYADQFVLYGWIDFFLRPLRYTIVPLERGSAAAWRTQFEHSGPPVVRHRRAKEPRCLNIAAPSPRYPKTPRSSTSTQAPRSRIFAPR